MANDQLRQSMPQLAAALEDLARVMANSGIPEQQLLALIGGIAARIQEASRSGQTQQAQERSRPVSPPATGNEVTPQPPPTGGQ